MIRIKVNGAVVSVQETEALYCGSENVHTCSFIFDESWEKYSKSAEFRVNGKMITAVIDENNRCILPWELLVKDNIDYTIEVGVYGVSADAEILTSVRDRIGVVREGTELGSDAREPSAGIYEQVMASVRQVDNKVVSYSEEVRSLTQRAESAAAISEEGVAQTKSNAVAAASAAAAAESALEGVQEALNNLPEGDTLIINDLTTGGAGAALSAEQGKVLAQRPNTNLIHNWYFVSPVNQRGQREYTGTGTSFDRWKFSRSAGGVISAALTGDGISCTNTGTAAYYMVQYFETQPAGTITLSALCDSLSGVAYVQPIFADGTYGTALALSVGVKSMTYTTDKKVSRVLFQINKDSTVVIKAVKLEYGDTQTLAYQDGDGNWVLNEIPDYGEELAKCQRYYQLFTSEDKRPSDKRDFRPELRTNATSANTGTIDIDGVAYYYANADL